MELQHFEPCEQRLLGYVAQNYPKHATFHLRNLQAGAAALRQTGLDLPCDCGRVQLAELTKRIATARKQGDTELREQLLAERRQLQAAVAKVTARRAARDL